MTRACLELGALITFLLAVLSWAAILQPGAF